MDIYKEFRFEAAHRLTQVPAEHKCARLHGHSFYVRVTVTGEVDAQRGWLIDFADVSDAFEPLYEQLDHRYLNDVDELANPTSENIARWIWRRLRPKLPQMSSVEVRETCNCGAVYRGEKE